MGYSKSEFTSLDKSGKAKMLKQMTAEIYMNFKGKYKCGVFETDNRDTITVMPLPGQSWDNDAVIISDGDKNERAWIQVFSNSVLVRIKDGDGNTHVLGNDSSTFECSEREFDALAKIIADTKEYKIDEKGAKEWEDSGLGFDWQSLYQPDTVQKSKGSLPYAFQKYISEPIGPEVGRARGGGSAADLLRKVMERRNKFPIGDESTEGPAHHKPFIDPLIQ